MNIKYRVTLWESERGWGQKPFLDKDFDTYEEAYAYYETEMSKNNSSTVPDWYVFPREPRRVDIDKEPKREY